MNDPRADERRRVVEESGGRGSFTQPLVLSSRVFHLLPSPRPPAGMNERRGTRRQGGKRLRQNDPRIQPLPPSFHRCSVPFTHLTPLSLGVNLLGHNGNSQDGRMKVLIWLCSARFSQSRFRVGSFRHSSRSVSYPLPFPFRSLRSRTVREENVENGP